MPLLSCSRNRNKVLAKINWADHQLYQHFNRTLWERIAKEDNFQEEVWSYDETAG